MFCKKEDADAYRKEQAQQDIQREEKEKKGLRKEIADLKKKSLPSFENVVRLLILFAKENKKIIGHKNEFGYYQVNKDYLFSYALASAKIKEDLNKTIKKVIKDDFKNVEFIHDDWIVFKKKS